MLKKEKLKIIRKWHPNTTIDNFRGCNGQIVIYRMLILI